MYNILLSFFLSLSFLSSCKQKQNSNEVKNVKDTIQFFPVMELLNADIDDVFKTPYFMYQITEKSNSRKRDSTTITHEKFSDIINPISNVIINKDQFEEVSFHDLSTSSISIITTSTNEMNPIKSITTLLNDKTNLLKSMFIVTEVPLNNSIARIQYYWKAEKSLLITTTSTDKKGDEIIIKQYINWNEKFNN